MDGHGCCCCDFVVIVVGIVLSVLLCSWSGLLTLLLWSLLSSLVLLSLLSLVCVSLVLVVWFRDEIAQSDHARKDDEAGSVYICWSKCILQMRSSDMRERRGVNGSGGDDLVCHTMRQSKVCRSLSRGCYRRKPQSMSSRSAQGGREMSFVVSKMRIRRETVERRGLFHKTTTTLYTSQSWAFGERSNIARSDEKFRINRGTGLEIDDRVSQSPAKSRPEMPRD